jgi:uncharacterized protein (TIGR00369 family)
MPLRPDTTVESLERQSGRNLPGWFGLRTVELAESRLVMDCAVRPELMAPNGFLHAGAIVSLADTAAGYATVAHLPDGASTFTTLELKSNFIGTATDGTLRAVATAAHLGRTTQVWDAVVTHLESARTVALFRCTQLILWPGR